MARPDPPGPLTLGRRRAPATAAPSARRRPPPRPWPVVASKRRTTLRRSCIHAIEGHHPEFRNRQFSYTLGQDGVEKFVATPELQSADHIGHDPLPPGQVWTISLAGQDEGAGLYHLEVTEGPSSGVRILDRPAPQACAESVKYAEVNLYTRASDFIGDRNPREHECSIQLRAFETSKHGRSLGVAALLALCSALITRSLRGSLVIVGGLNLGGSIDPLPNAIDMVERAVEKEASVILLPVSSHRQLFDLSDDLATRITAVFYSNAREACIKAIADA